MDRIRSVDIAICTWNRESLLRQTLDSVARLQIPEGIALSVLLVDNASTDRTSEVVEGFAQSSFADRHRVVSLYEPTQGHTFSRNCAVAASEGDLVLWTDDDVVLSADWVTRYVAAANDQPEVSFWGSQIEPKFVGKRPAWIDRNWDKLKGCFAARDLGEEAIELTPTRLPYGANFAVRGTVQRQNLFQTELGRRGELVLGEDELDLMRRLLAQGHRGIWVPGAVVEHLIPESRATTEYVFDYFVGQGRALAARGEAWRQDPLSLISESKTERRYFQLKRFLTKPEVWVSHLIRSALAQGQSEQLLAVPVKECD